MLKPQCPWEKIKLFGYETKEMSNRKTQHIALKENNKIKGLKTSPFLGKPENSTLILIECSETSRDQM